MDGAQHSPLKQLEENLWVVEGQVPGAPMTRRMCIAKRSDGKLVFFHAVPLDDATLAQVKALGDPAFLVIAHDQHGIDADAFQKKLGLRLYGPKGSEAKLRAKFDLDGVLEEVPKDADVEVFSVAGAKTGEAAMVVRSKGGASVLFSDVVMNVKSAGLGMRLAGFVGGPKAPFVWKRVFVSDKPALKAELERLAATPGLEGGGAVPRRDHRAGRRRCVEGRGRGGLGQRRGLDDPSVRAPPSRPKGVGGGLAFCVNFASLRFAPLL